MNAIQVNHLTKKYGGKAVVNDLSFEVKKGEIFGFLGSNGAGKTTTIRMLCTIIQPSSGNAMVGGCDLLDDPLEIRKRISVVPQGSSLNPVFTVRHNLFVYILLKGYSFHAAQVLTRKTLEKFGLEKYANHKMWELSGGYRKRVQLARTLACDSEIIFLDEPTTGLDPHAKHFIWDHVKNAQTNGSTVFITTQSMEEAEYLCNSVCFINKGELVEINDINYFKNFYGTKKTILSFYEKLPNEVLQDLAYILVNTNAKYLYKEDEQQLVVYELKELSKIISHLVQKQIRIQDIITEKDSLEDIYLKLIRVEKLK